MPSRVSWNYCNDPNDINRAISLGTWDGLNDADQIISITFDTNHMCYVVFWKV